MNFFYLASPDLLLGFESEVAKRNIVGVAAAFPELAKQGILIRKYGQEVIRHIAGKRIHGTGWRSQSNGASSTRSATCPLASGDLRCKGAPLGQRGSASLLVDLAGDEMALLIEMVVDLGVN